MRFEKLEDPEIQVLIVVVMVLALAAVVYMLDSLLAGPSAEQKCLDSGGYWHITGATTQMVMVGKIFVPETVPTYGCVSAP